MSAPDGAPSTPAPATTGDGGPTAEPPDGSAGAASCAAGATSAAATSAGGTPGISRIDAMLAGARARLRRIGPTEAAAEFAAGALLVDIRPAAQRAAEGEIPGARIIERNVLEWRLDPTSDARLPVATGDDLRVIVFCSEGYTSSLAAAALQDLGLHRATDLIGGYHAWAAAGLPTS
jgi:rhodanese-related sulfurtransferase